MRYTATIEVGGTPCALILSELSGVGSRQIADRDRQTTRVYAGWLDRELALVPGLPYWVTDGAERFPAYPVVQKGRSLRLVRRDGEFAPGLFLERIGAYDGRFAVQVFGGNGWFVTPGTYQTRRTTDFAAYTDVAALRGQDLFCAVVVQGELAVGGYEQVWTSADGMSWASVALPAGSDEVTALAWDGESVWVTSVAGLYKINWSTRAVTTVSSTGAYYGLSRSFDGLPFYARQNGATFDIYSSSGVLQRNLNLAAGVALYPWNWVYANLKHYTVDHAGNVTRFNNANVTVLATIASPGRSARAGCVQVGGLVLVIAYGMLYWLDPKEAMPQVRPVFDFGMNTRLSASPAGAVFVREDGLVYQVQKVVSKGG